MLKEENDVYVQVIIPIREGLNVIGACLHNKMIALQSFKHAISSKEVKGFLERLLSLFQKKTVFVMDNASFYKKKSIRLPSKLCKAFIYS